MQFVEPNTNEELFVPKFVLTKCFWPYKSAPIKKFKEDKPKSFCTNNLTLLKKTL